MMTLIEWLVLGVIVVNYGLLLALTSYIQNRIKELEAGQKRQRNALRFLAKMLFNKDE
jgi:hypothetical protein